MFHTVRAFMDLHGSMHTCAHLHIIVYIGFMYSICTCIS